MMPTERFERQFPELLTELAAPRTPDYLDDLLWQTANTSQRPAWSLLERWLPMLDIARQPVMTTPTPWRTIGLGFVLLALLIAMVAALMVGGSPDPPAPFGPARNGLVAFETNGDIFIADAVTGSTTAIVSGPTTDINPRWSLDGTRLAFERKTDGVQGAGSVYVVKPDGSNPILVTPDPLKRIVSYVFSPTGQELLISASPRGIQRILVWRSMAVGSANSTRRNWQRTRHGGHPTAPRSCSRIAGITRLDSAPCMR